MSLVLSALMYYIGYAYNGNIYSIGGSSVPVPAAVQVNPLVGRSSLFLSPATRHQKQNIFVPESTQTTLQTTQVYFPI